MYVYMCIYIYDILFILFNYSYLLLLYYWNISNITSSLLRCKVSIIDFNMFI